MEKMLGIAKEARVKGTADGGFKFHIDIGERIMEWPQEESLTFEEALGMMAEVGDYFGLEPDQVLISVADVYYSRDNSKKLTEFRQLVEQSPTLLAAVKERERMGDNE